MTSENDKNMGVTDGAIDGDIQERLGAKLKDAYGEVLNEPVPDRFVDLLNQLAERETSQSDDSSGATGGDNGNE
ncbi:MAG: NepR family anti-sigma factor [Pseudomonadota bacterium]